MAGKGGYQRPTNPAPVSGPGALSQRTDGGPADKQPIRYISGLPYGEGQMMTNLQAMAPMEAAPSTPSPTPQGAGETQPATQQPEPLVPLNAPSARPSEPVTYGADMGPGAGSSALGLMNSTVSSYQDTRNYIHAMAANPSASPALKFLAQRINEAF